MPFHELLRMQQRVMFEIEDKKLSRFHETFETKKRPSSKKRLRSSRHFMQQFIVDPNVKTTTWAK